MKHHRPEAVCSCAQNVALIVKARGSRSRIPGGVLTAFVCHRSLGVAWLLGLPEAPPAPLRCIGPILEGESKDAPAMASWALHGSRIALETAVPGIMALLRRMHRHIDVAVSRCSAARLNTAAVSLASIGITCCIAHDGGGLLAAHC